MSKAAMSNAADPSSPVAKGETGTPRQVVLCNPDGTAIGVTGVDAAHSGDGLLHRAFSVFVFSLDGSELLLQQRSTDKKRFAGGWANTCCSHPTPEDGAAVAAAGRRRLAEELGFSAELQVAGSFVYQAADPGGSGSEHEHDTVLVGRVSRQVALAPDPAEVAAWRWITVTQLQRELQDSPERYVPWLAPALAIALAAVQAER